MAMDMDEDRLGGWIGMEMEMQNGDRKWGWRWRGMIVMKFEISPSPFHVSI